MKQNSFGQGVVIFLVVIGIFYFIGAVSEASEPKCIKAGCDNKQARDSSYCYLHKPFTGSSSSHSGSSYSNKSSSTSSSSSAGSSNSSSVNKSTTTNSSSYSSGTKKYNSYDSYDEGYDDIYMDGDYDYDRYDNDSDYADGVDDAMEESGEDW